MLDRQVRGNVVMQPILGGVQGKNVPQGVLSNLEASLQLLAARASDQVAHFLPADFSNKADEMALDFEHWSTSVASFHTLTSDQEKSLKVLNDYLQALSGEDNRSFWTDQALVDDPRWEEVRAAAKVALVSFGWLADVPQQDRYIDSSTHQP